MNIFFDHFLLYCLEPEKTFENIKAKFGFQEIYPIRNFGYFKSGMLWIGNTKLEILHYPKEIPAPNSNGYDSRFVGIALKTNMPPEETLKVLREKGIETSEILNEDVLDANGKNVTIAKVILLNGYSEDFRIFFIFDLLGNFSKTEEELKKRNSIVLNEFVISISNKEKVENLFDLLFLKDSSEIYFDTSRIAMTVSEKEKGSWEISEFMLKEGNLKIDLIQTKKA
jgi:hypothetical protein